MEILIESIEWLFTNENGWKYVVMWVIGGLLIYLAIKKEMQPTLLLPLGFGTIMVNLPFSGALGEFIVDGAGNILRDPVTGGILFEEEGALTTLFNAGIANE